MKCLRALVVGCSEEAERKIAAMLDPYGFDCIYLSHAAGALHFDDGDAIDLFVVDVGDPERGGRELIELIREGRFGSVPPPTLLCAMAMGPEAISLSSIFRPTIPGESHDLAALAEALEKAFPVQSD